MQIYISEYLDLKQFMIPAEVCGKRGTQPSNSCVYLVMEQEERKISYSNMSMTALFRSNAEEHSVASHSNTVARGEHFNYSLADPS